jgi:HD-GYP domain-containing protein (c-di-GMP phosphodiesterase class II)
VKLPNDVIQVLSKQDRVERSDARLDHEVRCHGIRVGKKSAEFAKSLGLPPEAVKRLAIAGRFHDIGKSFVRPEVLFKQGGLTQDERIEIDSHVRIGGELIGKNAPTWLRDAIMLHHERWDGLGIYGLSEGNIPLIARILSLVDVHDALMSPRSYKKGMSSESALVIMVRSSELDNANKCAFDPFLLRTFVSMELKLIPPSSAREALVEFAHSHPGRPLSSRGWETDFDMMPMISVVPS